MPSIEFKQFSCERGDHSLFEPLSFRVSGGDIVQIAGQNGAGKTTFLRSMSGLFADWRGEMLWSGEVMNTPGYDMRCHMLYLGHQPGVQKSLTARENLEWFFGVQGRPFPGSIENALQFVGLSGYEDITCHEMSAGQLRRVALARLYVTQAAVWVLDEPFTAIDKAGVQNLEALIQQHTAKGGMVILTTHQPLTIEGVRIIELQPVTSSGSAYVEVE